MQESEAKFVVGDFRKIELELQGLRAALIQPRIFEKNIRYDHPDKSLTKTSRLLRLRTANEATLTYKGPSENEDGILKRLEFEVTVDDPVQADLFLKALGYEHIFIYEKYRTTYEFLNSKIMLDELPIGNFIEIEVVDIPGIDAIHLVADGLKLQWEASIPESYYGLFERYRKSSGFRFADMTFANFTGLTIQPEDLGLRSADH